MRDYNNRQADYRFEETSGCGRYGPSKRHTIVYVNGRWIDEDGCSYPETIAVLLEYHFGADLSGVPLEDILRMRPEELQKNASDDAAKTPSRT